METSTPASRLFIIGSAASHTMSPDLWNPVLAELGCGWHYEAWDVPRDAAMDGVRRRLLEPDVVAANVTMPHKKWAAGAADSSTEDVRLSGACNLLVRKQGTLRGHNTDITAARVLLGGRHHRHSLMMGAGGAARASLIALAGRSGKVTITDRDPGAAGELLTLARSLGMAAEVVAWEAAQVLAPTVSLIVNATPIGKSPSDAPVWGEARLSRDAFVYDYVYAGEATASIRGAREQGIACVDGWDHLREQAVAMIPLLGLDQRAASLVVGTLKTLRTQSLYDRNRL
jgi:shikimate dehydrogenase